MHTNLDAQFLADLSAAYVAAEIAGDPLPVIDNAIAARLRRIADNISRFDERVTDYEAGFAAGLAHQHSRSNIISTPLSKDEVRVAARSHPVTKVEAARKVRSETIRKFNINLADLGL